MIVSRQIRDCTTKNLRLNRVLCKKSRPFLMTQKNRNNSRTRISQQLADIVNDHGNVHTVVIETKKGRDVRQYMNEVDSQMIRVNLNNIGDHLDLVIKIVTTFTVIKANLDQYHAQSHNSMDSIAFLNKKFENINNVIDTYNAYVLDVRTNPFIRSQYEPIENVSLEGVWLIGRSGKVDSIGSAPVIDESVMPKSLPTSQEDRIAIGEVFK